MLYINTEDLHFQQMDNTKLGGNVNLNNNEFVWRL